MEINAHQTLMFFTQAIEQLRILLLFESKSI